MSRQPNRSMVTRSMAESSVYVRRARDDSEKGQLALAEGKLALEQPAKAKRAGKKRSSGAKDFETWYKQRDGAAKLLSNLYQSLVLGLTVALKETRELFANGLYLGNEQAAESEVSMLFVRTRKGPKGPGGILTTAFLYGEKREVEEVATKLELEKEAGVLVVPLPNTRFLMRSIGRCTASWGDDWQEMGADDPHTVDIPLSVVWPEAPVQGTVTIKLDKLDH